MSVLVFGSINMDLVARAARLPVPGETVIGEEFVTVPGGKGANQAVACARLGAPTKMIGRVGDDLFGIDLRRSLQENGVDVSVVGVDHGPSGIAQISVDGSGENSIIVVPGANGQVGQAELERLESLLVDANVLLLQLEVPLEPVVAAAKVAHERGLTVILDPAPARPLPDNLYPLIDILTPNETETAVLVGFPIKNETDAKRACTILQERGAGQVIIKLGAQGVYVSGVGSRPSFPVTAVDTVAAGDAFNGALAAGLNQDHTFAEAITWGLAAGALAVTQPGAQSAMPDRDQLFSLMNDNA